MLPALKSKPHRRKSKRSPLILFLLILAWSVAAAWVLAISTHAQPVTTDAVPQRYQLGQELYLDNCATCHIAVPPAVLPVQTWQRLLEDTPPSSVELSQVFLPSAQSRRTNTLSHHRFALFQSFTP